MQIQLRELVFCPWDLDKRSCPGFKTKKSSLPDLQFSHMSQNPGGNLSGWQVPDHCFMACQWIDLYRISGMMLKTQLDFRFLLAIRSQNPPTTPLTNPIKHKDLMSQWQNASPRHHSKDPEPWQFPAAGCRKCLTKDGQTWGVQILLIVSMAKANR